MVEIGHRGSMRDYLKFWEIDLFSEPGVVSNSAPRKKECRLKQILVGVCPDITKNCENNKKHNGMPISTRSKIKTLRRRFQKQTNRQRRKEGNIF